MKRRIGILAALLGCGGALAETEVYIGTSKSGIYRAMLDEKSGTLSPAEQVLEVKETGFFTLAMDEEMLFTTVENGVASFRFAEEGLKEVSRQKYPGGQLCFVALDESEEVLFGADYGKGSVVSFPVAEDGSIQEYAGYLTHEGSSVNQKRQRKPHAHSFYPVPGSDFAYALDLGTDEVVIYHFERRDGSIERVGEVKVPAGSGPRHGAFGSKGGNFYVLNELTNTISRFELSEKGKRLTLRETVSVLPAEAKQTRMTSSEIVLSEDGKHVYCATRDLDKGGKSVLSHLTVGVEGQLTLEEGVSARCEIPRNIRLTPGGKFLLVTGRASNALVMLKVEENGALKATGAKINVPGPTCVKCRKKPTLSSGQ